MNPTKPNLRAAVVLALLTACQQARPAAATPSIAAPSTNQTQPVQMEGLHNVVTYAPAMVCGGVPEGEEGLHTLAAMGIKTIVSVDGATPDAAGAERLGMRYVHLPISYDTVTPARQKELAQAIASTEGPIYMHCHHGKHRSAAALGSALVLAGKLTPEQATERMGVSGTAKEYKGLWKAVAEAKPIDAAQLKVDPATLPRISKVSGMVATMSEIDLVFDLVKQAQKAKWQVPKDHPDLVATKESKRLHDLYAGLQKDPDSQKMPADYQAWLEEEIANTRALDAAIRGGDTAAADKLFDVVGKSCKTCHTKYRDNS
ncbi:MAG: cytochrome c [Planctomycetes bacterium]|nr:cytochrome c [Planctomycetota bacterium]